MFKESRRIPNETGKPTTERNELLTHFLNTFEVYIQVASSVKILEKSVTKLISLGS